MDIFKTLILDTPDTLSNISGILPVSNGGTGADNAPDARVNLLPSYTGNANKVLSLNGGATDVEWTSNGAGDVVGPASATDNAVVRYDGTTGKLVQDSGVTISDSGSVGIGSTAPAKNLAISSNANSQTTATIPGIRIENTDTTASATNVVGEIEFFSKDASEADKISGFIKNVAEDAGTKYALTFGAKATGANAAEAMRITNAGLVGIGTASPAAKLSVTNTANDAGAVALLLENADGNAGIGSRLAWRLDNLANEWGYINVNRVGGGATAQMDFAVNGAAYSGAASTVMSLDSTGIQMATTSQISFFTAGYFVRASAGLEVQSADYTRFLTNGANERMRIDASGNVGIGTTSPAAAGAGKSTLDVNGPVLARGGVGVNQTSAGALDTSGNDLRIRSWGATAGTGSMSFRTGGGGGSVDAEAMRITSAGKVGIGTASPAHKLTVSEASTDFAALITNSTSSGNGLKINAGNNSGDRVLELNDKDGTSLMRVLATGNVGIGTTSPSYQLQLSTDSAAKPSTNTWTIASDARIKTETGEYTKGLDAVLALRPVTYRYNGKAGMIDDGEDKISIIAQEAITAFPECVGSYMVKLEEDDKEETEVLNWNGHALTFALVNAVKELTARIAALENN